MVFVGLCVGQAVCIELDRVAREKKNIGVRYHAAQWKGLFGVNEDINLGTYELNIKKKMSLNELLKKIIMLSNSWRQSSAYEKLV